uniref:Uncharacterized protein n=1 Tax=Corethron hystrix TaxID=216773 RepID=A0A7S1BPN5_9STRA|mmetsp:Transcript_34817/g.80486  ORF Transcript_34817/g.80486 Transcript_34817/m.80486 type:complete len:119 (+) Transcript_34817:541-897(+)
MKHHQLDQLPSVIYTNNANGLMFLQKGKEQGRCSEIKDNKGKSTGSSLQNSSNSSTKVKCWQCGGNHLRKDYPIHKREIEEKKGNKGSDAVSMITGVSTLTTVIDPNLAAAHDNFYGW